MNATSRILLAAGCLLGGLAVGGGALVAGDTLLRRQVQDAHTYAAAEEIHLSAEGAVQVVQVPGATAVNLAVSADGGPSIRTQVHEANGDGLELTARCAQTLGLRPCRLQARLTVPSGTWVVLDVPTGEVAVQAADGTVTVHTDSAPVTVTGGRDVRIDTVSGDVEVVGANRSVRAWSRTGRIHLADLGEPPRSDVRRSTWYSSEGKVGVSVPSSVYVRAFNRSGPIDIESVGGDVLVETYSGSTDLVEVAGMADVTSRSGDIRLVDATGNLVSDSGNVSVAGPVDVLAVRTTTGDIEVEQRPARPGGMLAGGTVMPGALIGELCAQTDGTVESTVLELTPAPNTEGNRSCSVTLTSRTGNIGVRYFDRPAGDLED